MSFPISTIKRALHDGVRQLVSRPIYVIAMIVVPLFCAFFFLDLMSEGLPLQSPVAVVDLDNSPVSRNVTRNLGTLELIDIKYHASSYEEAMSLIKSGKIYGFFMIPRNFQAEAESGREVAITYYCNMAYYVPGTLSYKSFKQTAVTTSGGIAMTTLVGMGVPQDYVSTMLQPVTTQQHPMGNPWLNYSIYLSNSFAPCVLQLMIFLVTVFSVLQEIKTGNSTRWLSNAGGSIVVACAGKLVPQFIIFSVIGVAIQSAIFGYMGFPMNGSLTAMILAMLLFVAASQAFALFIASILPNLRLALSIMSLVGILSFSVAGFSFPVEDMYPAIGVFSYLLPVRYYFLIYVNTALNGYEVYFCRWDYIALILFNVLPLLALWKLKKHSMTPVYIP